MSLCLWSHWGAVPYWTVWPGFSIKDTFAHCMAHSKLQREHAKPVKKIHAFLQYMINGREDINYTMLTHPNWMIPPLPIHGNRNKKGNGWLSYKPNSLSPMTKKEAGSDKWARMQWWCSWHSPEARNFRRALLPATVWQREVERIGPVAVPIPQHLCEELFLQAPRRTICSCLLDHAGSSATFQQINLCIFEIKEGADKSRERLWETGGVTISKLPFTPSTNQKDNLLPEDKDGDSCHGFKAHFPAGVGVSYNHFRDSGGSRNIWLFKEGNEAQRGKVTSSSSDFYK